MIALIYLKRLSTARLVCELNKLMYTLWMMKRESFERSCFCLMKIENSECKKCLFFFFFFRGLVLIQRFARWIADNFARARGSLACWLLLRGWCLRVASRPDSRRNSCREFERIWARRHCVERNQCEQRVRSDHCKFIGLWSVATQGSRLILVL